MVPIMVQQISGISNSSLKKDKESNIGLHHQYLPCIAMNSIKYLLYRKYRADVTFFRAAVSIIFPFMLFNTNAMSANIMRTNMMNIPKM